MPTPIPTTTEGSWRPTGIPWVDAILRAAAQDPMGGLGPTPSILAGPAAKIIRQQVPALARYLHRRPDQTVFVTSTPLKDVPLQIRAAVLRASGGDFEAALDALLRTAGVTTRTTTGGLSGQPMILVWLRKLDNLPRAELAATTTPAHEALHAAYLMKHNFPYPPRQHIDKLFQYYSSRYPDLSKFGRRYAGLKPTWELGKGEAVIEGMARKLAGLPPESPPPPPPLP